MIQTLIAAYGVQAMNQIRISKHTIFASISSIWTWKIQSRIIIVNVLHMSLRYLLRFISKSNG